MRNLNRRQVLRVATVVVTGSTFSILLPQETAADGFSFSGVVKGVGGALVQGMHYATQPVLNLVQQGAQAAASIVQAVPPTVQTVQNLTNQVQSLTRVNPLFPLFCNPTLQSAAIGFLSNISSAPLQLGDSDEQFLRGDPTGFLNQNVDMVGGVLSSNAIQQPAGQVVVNSGTQGVSGFIPSYQVHGVPLQTTLPRSGFYPSALSFPQIMEAASLLSIFFA